SSQLTATWPLRHIPAPRRASLLCIGLLLAIFFGLACYGQLLARPAPEKWFPPAAWLPRATHGLVNGTLTQTVTIQLILIVGFLLGVCRFRPREIGLDFVKLPSAAFLTTFIWAANQALLVIVLALSGQEITVNPQWTSGGWTWAAGAWLGQLFGNTPLEEVIFRGFLLPQCLLLTLSWLPKARAGIPVLFALVLSQAIFTMPHVFYNAYEPQGQWILLAQFAMGLLFAGVYLRTGNLFLAMGLHTLVNNPGPLLKDPFPGPGLGGGMMGFATLLAVIVGPWVARHVRPGTPDPSPSTGRDQTSTGDQKSPERSAVVTREANGEG
ncbi:MAG TPA: CPBP family intramembrane glutamic endopeptidase, partial [Terriglobales bacterium]